MRENIYRDVSPFLKSVAKGYARRYAGLQGREDADMTGFRFVFPNKRSGTFFLKYLKDEVKSILIAPEVTTISDFVTELCGCQICDRLDLLFVLFNAYKKIVSFGSTEKISANRDTVEEISFDNFRLWGETVLRDFNEVDMQYIEAEEIFKNVKDLREISTDFLTEEQKDILEEYFGRRPNDTEGFWRKYPSIEEMRDSLDDVMTGNLNGGIIKDGDLKYRKNGPTDKFIHLWQILNELYKEFHVELSKENVISTGGAYRLAADRLEENGENVIKDKKIIFVGFNALSRTERMIFKSLSKMRSRLEESPDEPLADFVWDSTGPILRDHENPAGRFVAVNRKYFPSPEWLGKYLKESSIDSLPGYMEVIASPSNSLQNKIAGDELKRLASELGMEGKEMFEDARVALILPDENLLLPLLYSLPPEIGTPNLTMGYSLRMTSVASFMALLRNLQLTQRNIRGIRGFAIDDLDRILTHPISHAVLGTKNIRKFRSRMRIRHRLVVTAGDIAENLPGGVDFITPLSLTADSDTVLGYLQNVLRKIVAVISAGTPEILKGKLELAYAVAWQEALGRLNETIRRHKVNLNARTIFMETDRMLGSESVPFEGEPLAGLQIMGLLETRLLDFDHVIILSMNDKIIPLKSRQRTFIPDSLRRGFGMPPANYQENIFAYYFFRLISRAKSVRMVYDDRIGLSGGGPSRYVRQLEYLYAPEKLVRSERKLVVTVPSSGRKSTGKSEATMSELRRFLSSFKEERDVNGKILKRRRRFSASSLKKYCGCQLKFYIESIAGIRTDVAEGKTLDPIMYGNIFHSILSQLYLPSKELIGKYLDDIEIVVAEDKIEGILSDSGLIEGYIRREINAEYFRYPENELDTLLPPATQIIADSMYLQIVRTLEHDKSLTPFRLLGCEVKGETAYMPDGGSEVNMTFTIDRIDRVTGESGEVIDRIIDYKTGYVSNNADNMESLFVDMDGSNPSFQMMLYAELVSKWLKETDRKPLRDPRLIVYDLKRMNPADLEVMVPKFSDNHAERYSDVSKDFVANLDAMLREIYDPDVEFRPAKNESECRWCDFVNICRIRNNQG